MMRRHVVAFAALGIVLLGVAPAGRARLPGAAAHAIEQVTPAELRAHVETLAADEMAGRGLGHPGNQRAERYIAAALERGNVPPASTTFFQPVEVYRPTLGSNGRLVIEAPDGESLVYLKTGPDFQPLPASSDRAVEAPLVYAGHGISVPQWRHDDYAGLGARGAVVLVLDGVPDALARSGQVPREAGSALGTLERKISDARAHGAAGLLIVRSYLGDPGAVWPRQSSVRSASYRLVGPMHAQPLAVAALSARAAVPVRQALAGRRPLTVALTPGVVVEPIVMNNVIGMIEGRARNRAEIVVVGAHLDHDGIDEDGQIYNGADDNASGTAAVLAMAAAFARAAAQGERPARAVVFALWNGEEKGSLGAQQYVTAPQPPRRIVANVNLDMVGRHEEIPDLLDPRFSGFDGRTRAESVDVVHVLGYSYSPDFSKLLDRANESVRLTIKEDYDQGAHNLLRRSDNWPFLERGVPALFLTTGLHPDYHTPDDDVDRVDFRKLERITELASRLAWLVADGTPPRFVKQ